MNGKARRFVAEAETDLAPEVRAALAELTKARDYAEQSHVDVWEFAVEIEDLMALGPTKSDLRWLVVNGYVECADEITRLRDKTRKFRPVRSFTFGNKTCFILAGGGLRFAGGGSAGVSVPSVVQDDAADEPQTIAFPRWDGGERALYVGDVVVKRFPVPAPSQETVLASFQEEGWPRFIDDPLPPRPGQCSKDRLHDAIKRLNANQVNCLLHFRGDGTGQRVGWELIDVCSVPFEPAAGCERAA